MEMSQHPHSGQLNEQFSALYDFLHENDWSLHHTLRLPPRTPVYEPPDDLNLSAAANRYIQTTFTKGLYRHQKEALSAIIAGNNVCLATGTASGKSMVFYAAAIEELQRNPQSRILLVYPLKALGREQEGRLRDALTCANLEAKVGRIDGQVPLSDRPSIFQRSRLVIATPDILHAWMLSSLSENAVKQFLRRLSLVIVDEVHNYSGVFGSNSAFLFRRIEHIVRSLDGTFKYIAASATIANPNNHLLNLMGTPFYVVGPDKDTSPKHSVDILFLRPPCTQDLLSHLRDLFLHLSESNSKFIAFLDSRKQVEYLSAIMKRNSEAEDFQASTDSLERMNILPFRAGYELQDRDRIQDRLSEGRLCGVVCTSALELGIDIPSLDTAILVGVPQSRTSLLQRIGRVGRHRSGVVLIVNRGDLQDEQTFREADRLFERPLSESSLYLENPRIQYIHALCLARHGGEHDQISPPSTSENSDFSSPCDWPNGFLALCQKERVGEIPVDLQTIKMEGGEDPNHVFPLRDVESQFQVELKQGPDVRLLGSLSHGQVLREAYPGAVYYYTGQPFRVYKILQQNKKILVRRESHYTTKPVALPTLIFPNLSGINIHRSLRYGEMTVVECNLQVREAVSGYKERRGNTEVLVQYPLSFEKTGIAFDMPRFTRNYFTTGLVITHPVLSGPGVKPEALAGLIFEAFLSVVPIERQDVGCASDKHRVDRGPISKGQHFICLYDQTYGSLRLSGRLLDERVFRDVLFAAIGLAETSRIRETEPATFSALEEMHASAAHAPVSFVFDSGGDEPFATTGFVTVILPGSKGLDIRRNNEEFFVEKVFYSPSFRSVAYRGKHASVESIEVAETIPLESLLPIPGESRLGKYNAETGDLVEA